LSEEVPEQHEIDRPRIERAVREILIAIGDDPEREGVLGTPERVADAYAYLFAGLGEDPTRHLEVGFAEDYRDTVLVRDIPLYSTCEHHLIPFAGKAHVGYAPEGRVVGLSKLARLVEGYARRPQLQEQLTVQIADALYENLGSRGSIVVIEAEHLCYDRETEVLTQRGWIRFDQLAVDDLVAQVEPSTLRMDFSLPSSYVRYRYKGKMHLWRSDTVSLLVTPDHRMVHRTEWNFRKGFELPWSITPSRLLPPRFYVPQIVSWDRPDMPYVQVGDRLVPGDDYAALMGIWLAEGCTRGHRRDVVVSQTIGAKEIDIWSLLKGLPFGFKRVVQPNRPHVHFKSCDKALYEALRPIGKSGDRFVPRVVKDMSKRQIEVFLRFYAMGDGHEPPKRPGRVHFVSKSHRLIDDVQELLVRTGKTGAVQCYPNCSRLETKTSRKGDVGTPKGWAWLSAKQKEIVDFDDEVFCVNVPTGALLVRREGRTAVSGNCMTARGVQKPGSVTVTSAVRGIYEENEALRAETMALISRGPVR
jgi:GTP cyclohydrolase I